MSRPLEVMVGDRWAIIGATGSGKTVLSREILKFYAISTQFRVPIYILDTKMQGDFREFESKKWGHVVDGNFPDEAAQGRKPFTVWKPEEDDFQMYNQFFKSIYQNGKHKKRPAIIYIDELSSICNNQGRAPRYYDILLKQGRGMHIGVLSTTQSPSFVPSNLLRQTTHIIKMHINDDYDTKKLAKVMGNDALNDPANDYGFWYRNCTKPLKKSPSLEFKDFKDFLGVSS